MSSRTFEAQWPGECYACGEWYPELAAIKYDDDNHIVHDHCPEDISDEFKVCGDCNMVHAPNQKECW